MDVNTPVTNPKLVKILDFLKAEYNPQKEQQFFKALSQSHFLAPITDDSMLGVTSGQTTLKENTSIKFINLQDTNGALYLPIFTDWGELGKWNSKSKIKTLILQFSDCNKIVTSNENLDFTPYSSQFGKSAIAGHEPFYHK